MPADIEVKTLAAGSYKIIDLICNLGLSSSRGEARRLVEQGGIKIGSEENLAVVTDSQKEIEVKAEMIIQRGKRQFVKIMTE